MLWETNHQRYPHHFVAVSPIANRYSPFATVFGSAEPRSPKPNLFPSPVPRPSSRFGSVLKFRVTNYGLRFVAWFAFGCIVNLRNSLLDCWNSEGGDRG